MDKEDIAEELQETMVEPEGTQEPEDSPPEKMLPASYVNELVKKAKRKGEQKMQEQLDAARQQIEQLQAQQQQPQEQPQATPQGVDPQVIQKQVMELMQKQMQEDAQRKHQEQLEQEVNEVAKNYFGKLAQGKDLYEDFEAVTADFDPAAFPQLVYLATQADNTAAIIYELKKNPAKLATLSHLVDKSPAMARSEIAKLSQSIKTNEEAKRNEQTAADPLSRLKPSTVGTDNGAKSVRDYKSASYLRG